MKKRQEDFLQRAIDAAQRISEQSRDGSGVQVQTAVFYEVDCFIRCVFFSQTVITLIRLFWSLIHNIIPTTAR